jgi:hypothetical protein
METLFLDQMALSDHPILMPLVEPITVHRQILVKDPQVVRLAPKIIFALFQVEALYTE